MLVWWITFFLGLITFSGNITPALLGGGGGLVVLLVRRAFFSHGRKPFVRNFALLFLGGCLAVSSIWRKIDRYNASLGEPGRGGYIGSGQIIESHGKGRYLFRESGGRELLYYSNESYSLGSRLFTTASYDRPFAVTGMFHVDINGGKAFLQRFSLLQSSDWERGFDKEKRLLMKGRGGALYEKRALRLTSEKTPFFVGLRESVRAQTLLAFPDQQTAALSLGMLIGDRSLLTAEAYDAFVDSGLVHLIAVSGGNIVLIISLLSALLFFLPYYVRLSITAGAVVIYALICGFDSSIIRATCMALLSILALFFGRSLNVRRSMGYTYIGMLLRNPYFLLYDLGFIFSFSALAGLVYFAQRRKMTTMKKWYRDNLTGTLRQLRGRVRNLSLLPSIAASIGIFPTLLFFTGRVNLLSILSNLFVLPLVPFVMIYGFFISFLYKYISRSGFALPQQWAVSRIYAVNERGVTHAVVINANEGRAKLIILLLTLIILVTLIMHHKKITNGKRMV